MATGEKLAAACEYAADSLRRFGVAVNKLKQEYIAQRVGESVSAERAKFEFYYGSKDERKWRDS